MANFSSSVDVLEDLTVRGGCVTFSNAATDIDLIDNNVSALSFDSCGKSGILEIVTTNCSEGVAMSGTLEVTGLTRIGSCFGTCGITTGLRIDGTDGETSLLVADGCVVFRDNGVANQWQVELTLDVDGNADFDVTDFDVLSSGAITLNAATFVTIGGNATNAGEIRMLEDTDDGSNYVAMKAPNVSTSYTMTWPTAVAGTCGFALKSTTAGVLSWGTAGGASVPNPFFFA